jgi:hypothetical protein
MPAGRYDARAEGCDGSTYWELFDFSMETGDFEWTLTD